MLYKLVKQLLTFSPREGKNETKAGKFIINLLNQHQIKYQLQKFTLKIPHTTQASLKADSQEIDCQNISFTSGAINNKANLISNQLFIDNKPYINFNPLGNGISASNRCIKHPALAISKKDLPKILKAKKVKGIVKVMPVQHRSQNILVGNLLSPQNLIFTHYDSINLGATDNATGVAVSLKLIIEKPKTLKNSLFILSGNEELSYDFPIFWGYGYRVFEKKYYSIMKNAKKIFIIDGVGNGKTQFLTDPDWLHEGFPVKNLKKLLQKAYLVTGDIDKLMSVYHSQADDISQISKKYLQDAYKKTFNQFFKPFKGGKT